MGVKLSLSHSGRNIGLQNRVLRKILRPKRGEVNRRGA
jgi:hypothetical protein